MSPPTPKHCIACGQPLTVVEHEGRLRRRCSACGWTHYGNPTPVVAALVEDGADVILVRNQGWPEKWFGLVSGFLEANERPADAVLREVREELGCAAELVGPIGSYAFPEQNEVILAFHVRALGELHPGPELAEVKRVPVAKLRPWPFGTGHAVRDWLEARRPQKKGPFSLPSSALSGEGWRLRPWEASDAAALVEAAADPEIGRWTRVPSPYSELDARSFLATVERGWAEGTMAAFAIVSAQTGALLGAVGLNARSPGVAEGGYWIATQARGHGIATGALRSVSAWAFAATPGLERIQLLIAPENVASVRVAERAGYSREGLLRRYLEVKGELRDVLLFSRVREA